MKFFRRAWRVIIGTKIGSLSAGLDVSDLRVTFDIDKSRKQEPNTCTVKVYNLSKQHRAAIVEQRPNTGSPRGIPILVEAGYDEIGGAHQLFLGDLRIGTSAKEGADWVTTIESGDGEQAKINARINVAMGPGTSPDVAMRAIVKALGLDPGNSAKAIAAFRTAGVARMFAQRAYLSGSAWKHMVDFCRSANLEFSVQDGALQIVDANKTLSAKAVKLSPKTGLVGSPSVDAKGVLSCTAFIQPNIQPARLLVLDSPSVQGNFSIERVQYEGDTHGTPWYAHVEGKRY